ncbi:hypothetical protein NL533_33450, partial [Klebsiella pneumoniae]|nr:hypothetical protein [Klebsiella pneumoniae]
RNYARTARILLRKKPLNKVKLARLLDSAVTQIDHAGMVIAQARQFVSRDTDDRSPAGVKQCTELCLRLLRGDIRRLDCAITVRI